MRLSTLVFILAPVGLTGCADQTVKLATSADTARDSAPPDTGADTADLGDPQDTADSSDPADTGPSAVPSLGTTEGCTPAEAENLVADGGFEGGGDLPTVGGAWHGYTAGQEFGGWTVTAGSVEVVGSLMVAGAGLQWLDLDGDVPGAIEQVLATSPGTSYELRFCLAANPYSTGLQTVEVLWDGETAGVAAFDTAGMTGLDPGWITVTVSLPASWTSSAATALGLRDLASDASNFYGPALDEVLVVVR
jgi:hypothetical protein